MLCPQQPQEWLEAQLGVPQADVHRVARVMQYADTLAKVRRACFERSLAADRWETASELLQRRDELMLCGWDGVQSNLFVIRLRFKSMRDPIFTPSGSPLAGVPLAEMIDGPSIERVWNNFSTAISGAESWLTTNDLVPARPIQDVDDWLAGSDVVLIEKMKPGEEQSVCRYCDYTHLCGIEVTR